MRRYNAEQLGTRETEVQVTQPPADNSKDALAAFLIEIDKHYYPWYENSVKRLRLLWHPLYWSGLLIGACTAAVAALATEQSFKSFGLIRMLLVLLPILGAFLSTIVVQSQLSQRFQLRENGRRKVQHLLNEGYQRFAAARSAEEYSSIHAALISKLDQVEEEQGSSFFAFIHSPPSPPIDNHPFSTCPK